MGRIPRKPFMLPPKNISYTGEHYRVLIQVL
jgi:hypothetical protein